MPSFALLMRCLLIVALCFDVGVSQWTASAMAVTEAQQASSPERSASAQAGEDCEDEAVQGSQDTSHHDGDCDLGSGCCACVFPVAAITHAVPFAAQHALSDRPAARAVPTAVLRDSASVFRPPIG